MAIAWRQDELTLIVAGGVLGALAGFLQMSLGCRQQRSLRSLGLLARWGGPSAEGAVAKALRLSAGAAGGAGAVRMALLIPPSVITGLVRHAPKTGFKDGFKGAASKLACHMGGAANTAKLRACLRTVCFLHRSC